MPRHVEPAIVYTFEEAAEIFAAEPRIALDLETSGLSPWRDRAHVIALHGAVSNTTAILHYPRGVPIPAELLDWLGSRSELVMHNGVQFDLLFLANAGLRWEGPAIYDTMIGEQAVMISDRGDLYVNLAAAVKRQLGREVDKSIEHGRWGEPELDANQLAYVAGDMRYLLALREAQLKKAEKYPGMAGGIAVEMQLAKPVIAMQLHGLPIDRAAVERYLADMAARDAELEPRLYAALRPAPEKIEAWLEAADPRLLELVCATRPERVSAALKELPGAPKLPDKLVAGAARMRAGEFKLSSPDQLRAALAIRFGARMFPDTEKERLMEHSRIGGEIGAVCADLLRWRQLVKRQSMFSPKWFLDHAIDHGDCHRIHGHFWQLRTHTGRFSASEPNLQQFPKDMRHCIVARPGHAIGRADYAQIELRVMATLARDTAMIAAFEAGEDIHTSVVAAAFGIPTSEVTSAQRKLGKAMNFTLVFGGSWHTFYDYARVNGAAIREEEAERLFEGMLTRFTGVAHMRAQAREVYHRARPVTLKFPTGLHRQFHFAPGQSKDTTLLNNAVQAAAAAGLKYAMIEVWEAGLAPYLIATVHDELVYEAPLGEIEQVREAIDAAMLRGMARALVGSPPIRVEVESSWGPTWEENPETLRASSAMTGG